MPNGISFADAESTYNDADICIYGIPYDHTSCFRAGAREGPSAIRRCSYNFERTHFEHGSLPELNVFDYGDCDDFILPEDMIDEVKFAMSPAINDGKFTIAIGGEHSINIPIVQLFEEKSIALISIDAHLDGRDEYMGSMNSHACITRRAADHLGIDNVYALGMRSISEEELEADEVIPYISAYDIQLRCRNRDPGLLADRLDIVPAFSGFIFDNLYSGYAFYDKIGNIAIIHIAQPSG